MTNIESPVTPSPLVDNNGTNGVSLTEPTGRMKTPNNSLRGLRFEEQALARLSHRQAWWIRERPAEQPNDMPTIRGHQSDNETLLKSAARLSQGNSVAMLSIDVTPTSRGPTGEPASETSPFSILDPLPKLNWSKEARSDLLSAFFLGYVIFQIPAARAAELIGSKTLILLTGFGTGLTSILFVLSARLPGDAIWCAYLVRLLMGASQAGFYPAVYVMLCHWMPDWERPYWLPVTSAMSRLGTIVMSLFAPLIVRQAGWPMVFIVSGVVTLAWSVVFLVLASSSPASNRWITKNELHYIESRLEPCRVDSHELAESSSDPIERPSGAAASGSVNWLKVITNLPIGILTLVMFSSDWSNMLLLILLPSFLNLALGMEIEEIGIWTICLVAVYCFGYPLSGALASRLERADCVRLSSLGIRKLFEALAHLSQAAGCLIIGFCADKTVTLIALLIIMFGRSLVGGGQCLMPPELSKEFPGTVMAYANGVSSLAGFFGPRFVSWLVTEERERDSWRPLWFISAVLFLVCGLVFVLFADNSPQRLSRNSGPNKSVSQMQLTLPPYLPPSYDPQIATARGPLEADRKANAEARTNKLEGRMVAAFQTRACAPEDISSEPSGPAAIPHPLSGHI